VDAASGDAARREGSSSTFLRHSAGLAASQYVARAVLLARGLIAAASLGPAGFGAWNALNLILDYGQYASLGALQGLDLSLPAAVARAERERALREMRGAWWVTAAGWLLFALAVVAVLARGRWLATSGLEWSAPALMLGAAAVQLALLYHASVLRAHGEFPITSSGLALQALLGGGIGIALVWRFGIWGLLWAWIAGGLVALAWMRRSPAAPPLAPAAPRVGFALAARGLPLFVFFALSVVLRSLDRIALARYAGNQALGLYSLGLTAAGMVLYLPEAAAAVLFPRVAAAAQGARDPEQTRAEVVRAHRVLMAFLPVLVGAGVLAAPWVLTRALPAFAASVSPLRILGLAALALSIGTIPSYFLLGSGRALRFIAVPAAATVLTAALVFGVAMRSPRPSDVAWASAAGYALFALAMLASAMPSLAPEPRERRALWLRTLFPVAWAALLIEALSRGAGTELGETLLRILVFLVLDLPAAFACAGLLRVPRGKSRER
jgi:O-antigen/teichoic acid export membrane protein